MYGIILPEESSLETVESRESEAVEPVVIRLSDLTCITSSIRSLDLTTGQTADTFHIMPGIGKFGSVILGSVVSVGSNTKVENQEGERIALLPDDLVIGVIGNRYSTESFYGTVSPAGIDIPTEEPIDLLSAGGVVGICESYPAYMGHPTMLQVLGLIAQDGKSVNLLSQLRTAQQLMCNCPLILIAGTAAAVGKTTFATKLIEFLVKTMHWHVAATKLAGAGEYEDLLSLRKAGAEPVENFVDAGLPTTYDVPDHLVVPTIKGVLNRLSEKQPDVIVAELGGDILGASVPEILADPEILAITEALILIPSDVVAAYGAIAVLKETGFSGPVYFGQPIKKNPKVSQERARTLLKRPMFDCMEKEDLDSFVKDELGWSAKSESAIP